MTACPKPVKRSTLKRRKQTAKHANIADVRQQVEVRDGGRCRLSALLARFGFYVSGLCEGRVELAHIQARGIGGNPDLSRDTTANTLLVRAGLHQGGKSTMHGGYLKVEALTAQGADGPIAITLYEKLPSEVRADCP